MPGIINPVVPRIHPYPTRYHGTITVLPTFSLPYVRSVQNVLMPSAFGIPLPAQKPTDALGALPEGTTQGIAVGALAAVAGYVGMRLYLKRSNR